MPSDRARRLLELVDGALAVEPAERSAWLDAACAGDAELRVEVESLLALSDEADELLDVVDTMSLAGVVTPTESNDGAGYDGPLSAGAVLGDFEIEEQIGSGGMGVVYRARQRSLGRTVALKVLPHYLHRYGRARSRFRREVEASARLHHSNIVAVHTTGEEAETLYYAMELVDGPPLSHVIAALRRQPIPELRSSRELTHPLGGSGPESAVVPSWATKSLTKQPPSAGDGERDPSTEIAAAARSGSNYFDNLARMLAGVADGLAYAHCNRVVHRDIKPSNLLLSTNGRLNISDFGLARIQAEPGVTQPGEFVGTPYYMAPEQLLPKSDSVDGRTDVYALGATLYELLTLRPPFPGESRDQVLAQIATNEPAPPRHVNPRVPRDLDTICLKALEKDPAKRYQTADEMAADLRAYVNRFAISARRAGPVTRLRKWIGRHPSLAATLAVAGVLACVAVFFAYRAAATERFLARQRQSEVFEAALLSAMEGDFDTAREAIADSQQLGAPPGKIEFLNALISTYADTPTVAYAQCKQVVELLPDDLAAQCLLVLACRKEQRLEESRQLRNRIVARRPATLEEHLLKAMVETDSDPDEAIRILDEAVGRYDRSVTTRLIRGVALATRAEDTADVSDAEAALRDYDVAGEFMEQTRLLLSRKLLARMAAATACESAGQADRRQAHLDEAGQLAEGLAQFEDDIFARQHRALYFDYIGDTEQAIAEWSSVREHRILNLVLTLFREGRFEEALALCDARKQRFLESRWTDFLRGLVLSATVDSPQPVREAYETQNPGYVDPSIDHLFRYTLLCLAGDTDGAQQRSQRYRRDYLISGLSDGWDLDVLNYSCGEISAQRLVERAGKSRYDRAEAHYLIGFTQLSEGDREAAGNQLRQVARLRLSGDLRYAIGRAVLGQLERDPGWPAWIGGD